MYKTIEAASTPWERCWIQTYPTMSVTKVRKPQKLNEVHLVFVNTSDEHDPACVILCVKKKSEKKNIRRFDQVKGTKGQKNIYNGGLNLV